jgi:hypothetical protein
VKPEINEVTEGDGLSRKSSKVSGLPEALQAQYHRLAGSVMMFELLASSAACSIEKTRISRVYRKPCT